MVGRRVAEKWTGISSGSCLWRWWTGKRDYKSLARAIVLFMSLGIGKAH